MLIEDDFMALVSMKEIIEHREINMTCPKCSHTKSFPYRILVDNRISLACPLCLTELPKVDSEELEKLLTTFLESIEQIS